MLSNKVRDIKNLVFDMYQAGKIGHIPSSFSCAEIMTVLFYGNILKFNPKFPAWPDRDRFILSKGHAAVLYYAILADLGFFDKSELVNYGQQGSILSVHVDKLVPGVEVSTGSLGCGFGISVGMAYAAKLDLKNHFVFCIIGDGECYEGSIWESAMFAGSNNLNNLVVIIDHNHMCCSGFIEDNLDIEPLDKKWEGFGFDVRCIDGHSIDELLSVFQRIRCRKTRKPLCIIADTVKANGIRGVENTPLCHGYAPKSDEELDNLRKELNEVR